MARIIRLTERDLTSIVRLVIAETTSAQINFSSLAKPNSMDCESIWEQLDMFIAESKLDTVDVKEWKRDVNMNWDKIWVPNIESMYKVKLDPMVNKCLKDKVLRYFDF